MQASLFKETHPYAEPTQMIDPSDLQNQMIASVLVSRPGILRQSLQALLGDCRGIKVVAVSGDGLSALSRIQHLQPGLVIIDSNLLEEEAAALVAAVKTGQPDIRCLVFVQAAQQGGRMMSSGADAVSLRDIPIQLLQTTLNRLVRMANEPRE